jgi:hypothetical protein
MWIGWLCSAKVFVDIHFFGLVDGGLVKALVVTIREQLDVFVVITSTSSMTSSKAFTSSSSGVLGLSFVETDISR